MQKQSRGVFEALNPNYGNQSAANGRNFLKEYVRAIRMREKELKEAKQRQQELENAPAVVNKKYAHVESRVFKDLNAKAGSTASQAASVVSSDAKAPQVVARPDRHKSFGKVPEYLVEKRTREMEAKRKIEEEKRTPKIHCPPGHRILPEDERIETIALLENRKKEVDLQIQKLPLRIETDGQRRRQAELNKRLADIEQALKFLSKQNVLVKEDE